MTGGVGKQAALGHAGDGVGLEDVGHAILGHNEVAARAAAAPQRLVGHHGKFLYPRIDLLVQTRRYYMVQRRGLVLHLKVVELRARHNLNHRQRLRIAIAQHRHGNLHTRDAALNERRIALLGGRLDGSCQLICRGHARYAVARAICRRLHKQRQAQLLNQLVDQSLINYRFSRNVDAFRRGNARTRIDELGHILGRAHRRSKHVTERIGHMQYLEQALHAAILAIMSMHCHKGHVVGPVKQVLDKGRISHIQEVDMRKTCSLESCLAGMP